MSGCLRSGLRHVSEAGEMTLNSKRELMQAIRRVYRNSTKAQKSAHVDHLTSLIDKHTPFLAFFDFSFEWSFLRKQFLQIAD